MENKEREEAIHDITSEILKLLNGVSYSEILVILEKIKEDALDNSFFKF